MALTCTHWSALSGAAAFAIAMPAVLLTRPAVSNAPSAAPTSPPITPRTNPPIAAIYERSLFARAEGARVEPTDAPALLGIAGRLNRDAIAMVRLGDGRARSLAIGESVEGWRLESLAIDAAFFTRGRERVRVALASEPAPDDQ